MSFNIEMVVNNEMNRSGTFQLKLSAGSYDLATKKLQIIFFKISIQHGDPPQGPHG